MSGSSVLPVAQAKTLYQLQLLLLLFHTTSSLAENPLSLFSRLILTVAAVALVRTITTTLVMLITP